MNTSSPIPQQGCSLRISSLPSSKAVEPGVTLSRRPHVQVHFSQLQLPLGQAQEVPQLQEHPGALGVVSIHFGKERNGLRKFDGARKGDG